MDQKGQYNPLMQNEDLFVEKEIHLRDYLRVLSDRKNVFLTAFAIIMIVTIILTYSTTPMYKAGAKLLIEQNEKNPLISDLGRLGRDPEFLATQTEIIKSTAVGMKVVEKLNLDTTYSDYIGRQKYGFSLVGLKTVVAGWFGNAISTGSKIIGVAEAEHLKSAAELEEERTAVAEKIAVKLIEEINVTPVRDSRIVTLDYLAPNPVLAGDIVNAVVDAYIEKTFDMKMESSGYTLEWMAAKADEEKANLKKAERALQKYMEDNDIVTVENRETVTPQKLAEINSQSIKIQSRRKELELLHNRIKGLPPDLKGAESIQVIASDAAIQSLRNQILEAEKKKMDLSKTYGPKHPKMKQAVVDLEVLKQQRTFEIQRVMQAVKNEYDLIRESEREHEKMLKETKQEAVKLNEKFIQYNILKREVETTRQLYNALITKIKEQNMAEQAQSVKVWVIEKAKVPETPAKPHKSRNITLGIVLALFSGMGLAFLLEYMDSTVKNPDDVEERFNLPVIGIVAMMPTEEKAPEKEVLENSTGVFAENFKNIRTSVLLSAASNPPKRLLVTSMSPEEGKTTAAVNLAVSMAQAGKRVLLIDADMRRPRIHKIFNLNNQKGLSSYLAGMTEDDIIQKTSQQNLNVITSGPIPPNPSELLISEKTQKLIESAESDNDLIIFDTPPILTLSDGLIIGKLVEGVILIARAGKTPYDLIEKGQRNLTNIGARIIGVILNAVETKKNNYYYYYNHYYSSSYKEDDHK